MSVRSTPPFPGGDLRVWARQMVEYLTNRDQSRAEVTPQTILLESQRPPELPRPTTDGLMMYDPTRGRVVYAAGGAWVPMAPAEAVYGKVAYADEPAAAAWTPLTVTESEATPIVPGVYSVTFNCIATGVNSNSWIQIRVVADGTPIMTSAEVTVGNRADLPISVAFMLTYSGVEDFNMEFRSDSASIANPSSNTFKIGDIPA